MRQKVLHVHVCSNSDIARDLVAAMSKVLQHALNSAPSQNTFEHLQIATLKNERQWLPTWTCPAGPGGRHRQVYAPLQPNNCIELFWQRQNGKTVTLKPEFAL